jgi:hypothetical protein
VVRTSLGRRKSVILFAIGGGESVGNEVAFVLKRTAKREEAMTTNKRLQTAQVTEDVDIHGDRPLQQKARKLLPILVRQAKARQSITYQDLSKEIEAHHRTLNYPLAVIGNVIKKVGVKLGIIVPPLQAIVINKEEGLP